MKRSAFFLIYPSLSFLASSLGFQSSKKKKIPFRSLVFFDDLNWKLKFYLFLGSAEGTNQELIIVFYGFLRDLGWRGSEDFQY